MRLRPLAALPFLLLACDDSNGVVADTASTDSADATDTLDGADAVDTSDSADTADTVDVTGVLDMAARPAAGAVAAGVTVKAADMVRGPKAEGLIGDFKLWNAKASFIVEGIRRTGGYRQNGGNVVDIDLGDAGEERFGELWFTWNMLIFEPDHAEVVSNGKDGVAHVRLTGRTGIYTWANSFLVNILGPQPADLAVTYDYTLRPDSNVLELVITLDNDTPADVDVTLPIVAINMGDGVRNFGIGGGLGGVTGNLQPWLGMIGLVRSYGFIAQDKPLTGLFNYQNVQLLQEEEFSLRPGDSHEQRYAFAVTDDGTTGVAEMAQQYGVTPVVALTGTVDGEVGWSDDEPPPSNTGGKSWVVASQGTRVAGITPVDAEGHFRLLLAPGDYQVQAYAPQRGSSAATSVTLGTAPVGDVALALPALGEVVVTVTDDQLAPLPVQISFFRKDGAPWPFGPENAAFDVDWRHGRSAVVFSPDGLGRAHLLPGDYTVTASRGFSYEIDQADVTVTPGGSDSVSLQIRKVVDDSGWTADDGHLHSIWSPDSDVPYVARLRQAAANDVTIPLFTEHVNIGHAQLELDAAKVGDWIVPVPAQEITTFEYGHFNAYPLDFHPDQPSFGAVFEHGRVGAELFDAMRAQTPHDHIIQVNHPRQVAASGYLTYVDLDRATITARNPERWTTNWDVLEVFNETCSQSHDTNRETLQDWFAMNDHGLGKVLGSGSDSHSEAAGIGLPRNWIKIDKAAVEADDYAIVAPIRARQTFVSCGPFVRFETSDGKGMGELAEVDAQGQVTFHVHVESPSWIDVASVALLENGVAVKTLTGAELTRPDGASAAVRFDGDLTVTPAADAWYVVEVQGAGNLWPTDPGDAPYALTNPIEVDQDKDLTWTPPAVTRTAPARPAAPRLPAPKPGEWPAEDRHR
ncbi:MAG: CehA/McbA family metallohydrolase [Myxococcota bacterium]